MNRLNPPLPSTYDALSVRGPEQSVAVDEGEYQRVERERDLFLQLLHLGAQKDVGPFLERALGLLIDAVGARAGYVELESLIGDKRWSRFHGYELAEVEHVRGLISQGIIAEALATGETILTADARHDVRFRERESVQLGRIDSVLCSPIECESARGVVYLQGSLGHGSFTDADRALTELLASSFAPIAEHVLRALGENACEDFVAPLRDRLELTGVVGRSRAFANALEQAATASPWNITVLITGASGTGKNAIARLIHRNSDRAPGPLVEINCAAVPEALLENELFGAERGAHTTATHRIPGKIEAAQGGTLLLDEIALMPPVAQAKLLQLLQSKTYYPLGASSPVIADVRIVAATNTDLDRAVAEGRFREDLLYRLNVLTIRMPDLAERTDDLRPLATHFAETAVKRHGLPQLALSEGALMAIEAHEWPGNVRQLENAIEAATVRATSRSMKVIEAHHLFPEMDASESEVLLTFQEATRRFQREYLRSALNASDWNVSQAARALDLARSHVYKLISAFGFKRSLD